jgi:hypothetical protein
MAGPVDSIVSALAPGVALTSAIFYANGLATRFGQISVRVRDLNREARSLAPGPSPRYESIRWQVQLLTRRARILQRAIISAYLALLALILTTVLLLVTSYLGLERALFLPFGTFSVGLALLAVAMVISLTELSLSSRTLVEDVRSTFESAAPRA